MVREIDLDLELTCPSCNETHSNFYKEVYNHAPQLSALYVCNECDCGNETWKY